MNEPEIAVPVDVAEIGLIGDIEHDAIEIRDAIAAELKHDTARLTNATDPYPLRRQLNERRGYAETKIRTDRPVTVPITADEIGLLQRYALTLQRYRSGLLDHPPVDSAAAQALARRAQRLLDELHQRRGVAIARDHDVVAWSRAPGELPGTGQR